MLLNKIALHYGSMHMVWSYHETQLEIISGRLLNISPKQSHIVFSTLGYKAKKEIAVSLLKEDGANDTLVQAISEVSGLAKRNHLTHSIVSNDEKSVIFTKREIQGGLKIKRQAFNSDEIESYFETLSTAIEKVSKLSNITDLVMNTYCLGEALYPNSTSVEQPFGNPDKV